MSKWWHYHTPFLEKEYCGKEGHTFTSWTLKNAGKWKGMTRRECEVCRYSEIGVWEHNKRTGYVFRVVHTDGARWVRPSV